MKWLRYLLFVLLISGCAEDWTWYKPGLSHSEMGKDYQDCRYDARNNASNYLKPLEGMFGPAFSTSSQQEAIFEYCLKQKGYARYTYQEITALEKSENSKPQIK